MAITVVLTGHGRPAEALVVLVCFCALLRVGEAINLCREDFVFGDAQLVILLRTTKTGSHQRVVIDNGVVIQYLRGLLKRVEDPIRAAPTTYSTFRRYFTRALQALGLSNHGFRSHSLRRGGATTLFMRNMPLSNIMIAGRWASESSCRLYVRTGEAGLIAIRRAEAGNAGVRLLSALGTRLFEI